jgi:predicted nucleotidyltransferase
LVRPDSDIDVAVAFDPTLDTDSRETARRDVLDALADSLGALGERVDVVDVDRTPSALSFSVLRDGHRLISRSHRERVAVEVRILRRYDDEASMRGLFRRAAIASTHGKAGSHG